MENIKYCMIHTTVEDTKEADQIATALLQERLVACVQQSRIESRYHWKGSVACEEEILLQLKTKTAHFEAIAEMIETLHSYETPEIITLPILNASESYLAWIEKEVK